MGLNINGSWLDTRNGTVHFSTANDIDRVYFNNTLVWEKIRSLPDVNATHDSVLDFSSYPNLVVAEGYEEETVRSLEYGGGGGPQYKASAEMTQIDDYITFNLGAAYVGATVTLSIKAICSTIWTTTPTLPDVGVGWVNANGRTETNEPNYIAPTSATVDSNGNVTFQGWHANRALYLCACATAIGETLDQSGNTITNTGESDTNLMIRAKLRIQLDVVKDGMTASGYADFDSLSYNDVISIPVYHTN